MTKTIPDGLVADLRRGSVVYTSGGNQVFSGPTALESKAADALSAAQQRIAELERLDREAATYVESVICLRTDFEGDGDETGWRGLGAALTRALDARDAAEAALSAALKQGEAEGLRKAAEVAYDWGVRNPGPDHVSSGMKIAATIRALLPDEEKPGSGEANDV